MTRTKKYNDLRNAIELENIDCMLNDFDKWFEVKANQEKIKAIKGCKH